MKKTLLSALVVIALTAQLAGCDGNTPVEQLNESSSVVSDVSEPQNSTSSSVTESSSEPQSSTTATTSSVPEVSEPETSSSESNSQLEEKAKSSYAKLKEKVTIEESGYVEEYVRMAEQGASEADIEAELLLKYAKEQPPIVSEKDTTWTETAASGTYYINTSCSSRAKAIQGSSVVKQYKLNDTVNVIAKTDTGYYKLADGEFIHGDYLSTSKVTIQQPTQPSGGNNNGGSGSTGTAKPYEGTKHTPDEGATIIDTQTCVNRYNQEVTIYSVQTDGGTYYFDETTGRYFRTLEDALNIRNSVRLKEVFPNGGYVDWDGSGGTWH